MRILGLCCVIAIGSLGSGCRLFQNVVRTTIVEPIQYSRDAYERIARKQFIEMAELALSHSISLRRAELDDFHCTPYTVDYQQGFIEGYVDYLEGGGTGEPPLLPPRRYWNVDCQSPAGHLAAEDWFAGYRHGAELARASDQRSLVTVPLSDAIVDDTRPYPFGHLVASDRPSEERIPAEDSQSSPAEKVRVADSSAIHATANAANERSPADTRDKDPAPFLPSEPWSPLPLEPAAK